MSGAFGIDAGAEDLHPLLLRLDEAVLLLVLVRMRADQLVAAGGDGVLQARSSIAFCAGQQTWLALRRRSPLAMSWTCFFLSFRPALRPPNPFFAMGGIDTRKRLIWLGLLPLECALEDVGDLARAEVRFAEPVDRAAPCALAPARLGGH